MGKRSKITGFIHIYAVNDYKDIVENQVELIASSGLYDTVDKIYYVVLGDNQFCIDQAKYEVLGQSMDMTLTENFTLNLLRSKIISWKENHKVFYIHTKGVTRQRKSIDLWRMYMEYFILKQFLYCLDALEKADVTGCNRRVYARKRAHFSGNFWWANSSYLKTLPELSVKGYGREVNRWDGEFWIGDGNPVSIQLWNSKVHHQNISYYPMSYNTKSPKMILFKKAPI